jgi:Tfp pilus assembly protein PilN
MAARADLGALSILPRNERVRRERVAFKRAVLAGAGVAVLLIAADAATAFREQMRVRGLFDAQMPRVIEVRRDIELRKQAAEYARKVRAQEEAAESALGDRPDWAALLDELGVLTTDRVRLTDVNVQAGTGAFTASIHGVAELGDRAPGTPDPLAAYIEKLQKSAMIEGLELGSTRLGEYEGAPVKHFTVTARLVVLPAVIAAAQEDKP